MYSHEPRAYPQVSLLLGSLQASIYNPEFEAHLIWT